MCAPSVTALALTALEGRLLELCAPVFAPRIQIPEPAAVAAAFEAKCAELDAVRDGLSAESQRFLALTQIDTLWKAHMKAMGYVKDFAGLKVYAQEDPLDVYREEGLKLYDDMQSALRRNTIYSFMMYEPKAGAAAE